MATSEEIKLQKMQRQIKENQEEAAELRGQKTQLMKQLHAEGCESLEEAESMIADLSEKIESLQEELQKGIRKLEEGYQWS